MSNLPPPPSNNIEIQTRSNACNSKYAGTIYWPSVKKGHNAWQEDKSIVKLYWIDVNSVFHIFIPVSRLNVVKRLEDALKEYDRVEIVWMNKVSKMEELVKSSHISDEILSKSKRAHQNYCATKANVKKIHEQFNNSTWTDDWYWFYEPFNQKMLRYSSFFGEYAPLVDVMTDNEFMTTYC